LWVEATDLGMANDKMSAAHEFILPRTRFREICLHNPDLRVKPAQNSGVRWMFIQGDNLTIAALLKKRNKILTDQTGSSGYYNLPDCQLCHISPT
jgi:hypothetical protein